MEIGIAQGLCDQIVSTETFANNMGCKKELLSSLLAS